MGGKEIRRVPPNWEHPKDEQGHYIPLYDEDYETALDKWIHDRALWKAGTHPELLKDPTMIERWKFEDWCGNAPHPEGYREAFTEEPTWYQMYEDVSEGTPITPPFASKEELVDYLVENGDFWYQESPDDWFKPTREQAEAFVERGWAPGLVVRNTQDDVEILRDLEYMHPSEKEK